MSVSTDFITINSQSSIRIDTGREIVYVDPFEIPGDRADADIILITHDHFDHFSEADILKVQKPDTRFVLPEVMRGKLDEVVSPDAKMYYMAPKQTKGVGGLVVETVPAYNMHKTHHPKNMNFLGYIIRVGELRVYIAGDTDIIPEMKNILCDIAIVPIGGTYTMDAVEAAKLVNAMKPKVAIPSHFGSIVGRPEDADTFRKNVDPSIEVVDKLRF